MTWRLLWLRWKFCCARLRWRTYSTNSSRSRPSMSVLTWTTYQRLISSPRIKYHSKLAWELPKTGPSSAANSPPTSKKSTTCLATYAQNGHSMTFSHTWVKISRILPSAWENKALWTKKSNAPVNSPLWSGSLGPWQNSSIKNGLRECLK